MTSVYIAKYVINGYYINNKIPTTYERQKRYRRLPVILSNNKTI